MKEFVQKYGPVVQQTPNNFATFINTFVKKRLPIYKEANAKSRAANAALLISDNNETNDLKVIEEVDQANKLDQTSFSDDLIEVKVNTGFSSSIFSNKCQETEAEGLQFTLKLKQNKNVLKFTLK